jgi:hypothetical protein
MEGLKNQDGGLLRTIYANSLAIAEIALNDNNISDQSKLVIEQLKMQTQMFYQEAENNLKKFTVKQTEEHAT